MFIIRFTCAGRSIREFGLPILRLENSTEATAYAICAVHLTGGETLFKSESHGYEER